MQSFQTLKISVILVSLAALTTACGGTNNQRGFTPPSYASPTGQSWLVNCVEGRVIIPFDRIELFYNSSGEQKTMNEFCSESRFDSAIRAPSAR